MIATLKSRSCGGISSLSILLFGISFIEAISIIFIEIYTLALTNFDNSVLNVYLSVFILSRIFQVILVFDAIRNKNTIQLIGLCIFSLVCFGYSVIQIKQVSKSEDNPNKGREPANVGPPLIIVSFLLAMVTTFYSFISYKLYKEYGWEIYKKIGADTQMKRMYLHYQIFVLLLKLGVFFFMGFSLQFLVLVLTASDPEFWLNIIAFPITLLILVVAVYGVRYENRNLMYIFISGLSLAAVYFVYKIVMIYKPGDTRYDDKQNGLTMFASMTLISLILTALQAYVCYCNFGHGLSEHIKKSNKVEYLTHSPTRNLNLGDD
ncbi:hypothetical protein DSO57_1001888 [Entomophthora muscae]|uniref:Uncharacterized protein n=2 Tax=Entomophthora muscae TaxID=34485 RepID=A0ACC2TJG1_9FUNG|nr:hypothetical protein DSO57_1001862 [Entomophthora muscae]KAJ9074903.1 hypothetical protein DSO57_1001888 [Entomophthora muscae]